ncbi:MAG: type I-U CRISPR-associated protein Cas5/Cas6 [Sandaracinaceae bacterium]|nr:type I-U CRISPR-associated protein Cas5/Cas6 [Sandaracinaceae bacterium]
MATLVLRFPGGRYHATPAGHHVNEGIVEWPPSPWRLVRALVSCGYTTQRWDDVPAVGRRLVEQLASVLPEYRLPPAALGHSRHYMPTAQLDKGREKTTLVLDTFAHVGDGEIWVRWPVALDEEAAALFATLADHLGYLGRSESWVLARAVADDVPLPHGGRAWPHVDGERPSRGHDQVALTVCDGPADYASWRAAEVARALAQLGAPDGGKITAAMKKKIAKVEGEYPVDLLSCLQLDTAWWQERRWSQAPGSRRALYWRDTNALEVGPVAAPRRPVPNPVEAFLFALTTPSGSRSALPSVTRTLPQAELLHRALVSKLDLADGENCPELTGRDDEQRPLRGHAHAHVLPVDLDRDGRLDHIVLFARSGFGARAQSAIRRVERTYTKGGVGELQVALAGHGPLAGFVDLSAELGPSMAALVGTARVWQTATPFVPPRHLKKRGANTLAGQIAAELETRGLPPAEVEVLPWSSATHALRHYVRRRRGRGPQPPVDAAFVVRLAFAEPVTGPICLGYASHYGLGCFTATSGPDSR